MFKVKGVALISGLAVIIAVLAVDLGLRIEANHQSAEHFSQNADRARDILAQRIEMIKDRLDDLGIILAEAERSRGAVVAAFDQYLTDSNTVARHPEVTALAFHRYIASKDEAEISTRLNANFARRARGYADFIPRPPTDLSLRVVVDLVYPVALSKRLTGIDLMQTPRRATVEEAMADRRMVVTAPSKLFTGDDGVVLLNPFYLQPNATRPFGFTATAFRTDVFLQGLEPYLAPLNVDLVVHDLGRLPGTQLEPNEKTRLASMNVGSTKFGLGPILVDPRTAVRAIEVGGRTWRITVRPQAPLPRPLWVPDIYASIGLMLALLVSSLVFERGQAAKRLENQVELRTRDLKDAMGRLVDQRAEAEFLSIHDDLTGLLNRRGFCEHLPSFIETHSEVTVVAVDLDHFKEINDSLGHKTGDLLLKETAVRLVGLRPEEKLVARFGGDEFIVALPKPEAPAYCEAFLTWSHRPILIDEREVCFGASLGSTDTGISGTKLDQLLVDCDTALYAAKSDGKGQLEIFTPALRSKRDESRDLAEELRRALDRDEFEPFFQTQHCAKTRSFEGLEALVRWRHPTKGLLTPERFLPLANSLGLTKEIDLCMMHKTVDTVAELEAQGHRIPKASINVSLSRLRDPSLLASIDQLRPMKAKLAFEIIEAVFLDDNSQVADWDLDAIRERGIQLEIDDFGTGHASIVALTRLRPDRLKLDRELVAPLPNYEHRNLVRAIVAMGRAIGIPITAEGVETETHAQTLCDLKVDLLQGFLFSEPLSAHELRLFLERLDRPDRDARAS
ncbi:MAG: EAL domain-containing protein [Pseudomonadota bacterium]